MVGSKNEAVCPVGDESGSYSEIRNGQTPSHADEYYQCEQGNAVEGYQKQIDLKRK